MGGMFLGTTAWVERWRRALSPKPLRGGVPARRKLGWRRSLEEVAEAVALRLAGLAIFPGGISRNALASGSGAADKTEPRASALQLIEVPERFATPRLASNRGS